jgi:hypothetical protein
MTRFGPDLDAIVDAAGPYWKTGFTGVAATRRSEGGH